MAAELSATTKGATLNPTIASALGLEDMAFWAFLVACGVVVAIMATIGGLGTYAERKISADIQMRQGPNRVGPYGIAQFVADGLKMIAKEDIIPRQANRPLYCLAPMLCLMGVWAMLAVVPFSSQFILTDLNIGAIYLLGVSAFVGIGILLGGYASNSKWSMLGGMRGAAQIISYEVPVALSILAVVVLSGTLSFKQMVEAQSALPFGWFLLHNPFTFVGFFIFFVGSLAEANRAPFDLPEAESELVSGYHTEYSGMRFAFFALAEYVEVFILSALAVAMFLGGYQLPFDLGRETFLVKLFNLSPSLANFLGQLLEVGLFMTKTFILYYIVIWVRWTLPRVRVDQLMTICWKYLTPMALLNLVGVSFWMAIFEGRSLFELIFH